MEGEPLLQPPPVLPGMYEHREWIPLPTRTIQALRGVRMRALADVHTHLDTRRHTDMEARAHSGMDTDVEMDLERAWSWACKRT